jgi:hypothetical protein
MADQPAQEDPSQTATTKILALTQLHATLATILLVTTTATATTSTTTTTTHQHGQDQGQGQGHHQTLDLLAYLHFWCATLGCSWWYAAQALPGRALVRAGWKPVFHVLCVGLIGAFVGDMVFVGLRGFGTGHGAVVVGGDDGGVGENDEGGGGGDGDGDGYGYYGWVGQKVMGVGKFFLRCFGLFSVCCLLWLGF